MSNHKAHAFTTQMDADARIRHMQEQLRERDDTIVRLEARIAELEARPVHTAGEIAVEEEKTVA